MTCKLYRQKLWISNLAPKLYEQIRFEYKNVLRPLRVVNWFCCTIQFSRCIKKLKLDFPNDGFNGFPLVSFIRQFWDGWRHLLAVSKIHPNRFIRMCAWVCVCVMTTNDFKKIWQLMMLDYLSMRLCVDFVGIWVWSIDSQTHTHTY